jgi:hypothetical protein
MFCTILYIFTYLLQRSVTLFNTKRDSDLVIEKETTYSTSCSVTTILSFCRAIGFCNQSWLFIATYIQKRVS